MRINHRLPPCLRIVLLTACFVIACSVDGHYVLPDPDADPGVKGEWGQPSPLSNVNSTDEERHPAISSNGLELYFWRAYTSSPFGEIYSAVRASTSIPFGTPAPVAGVNTSGNENAVLPAHNGTELFFSQANEIMIATRPSSSAQWGNPSTTGIVALYYSLTSADLSLYFVKKCLPGVHNGIGPCLFKADRAATGAPWSQPVHVPWPGGSLQWNNAHISGDGLHLLLSSPFSGSAIRGAQSHRASLSDQFGPLEIIDALSLESTNAELRWNADRTEIYLTANPVVPPVGDYDIFISVLR